MLFAHPVRRKPSWTAALVTGLCGLISVSMMARLLPAAEETASVERRLSELAEYLSSDDLEGRGIGTKGLDAAADRLGESFQELGLSTRLFDGTPYQQFSVTSGSRLGAANRLVFEGPSAKPGQSERIELKVASDFNPLAIGGSGQFRLPLVFVGYGITAKKEGYDDYAEVDVKGKAVVILRHEPQQDNPHSVFDGTDNSRHAPFANKVSNAYQHGAAAVIFCTDQVEIERRVDAARRRWQAAVDEFSNAQAELKKIERPTPAEIESHRSKIDGLAEEIQRHGRRITAELDPVIGCLDAGEDNNGRDMPVVHCRRAVLDKVVQAATGKDLAALEKEIDQGPTPRSVELTGWSVQGATSIEREKTAVKNVVAVLEGEGPRSDEAVIIGAHYDHLGLGGPGSAAPGEKEIHNGADDNASGTAVLVEVARRLAGRQTRLPRAVVFIAFTGEERGLLGSAHYVRNAPFPMEKTVAMLNMDMVGRLQDNKLIVSGTGTAEQFPDWLDKANAEPAFHLIKKPSGFGPSDHSTFYGKKIPVLHFFTGSHKDYHRPSDDFEKLNVPGMRRVADLVTAMAVKIAETDERPRYQETTEPVVRRGGNRPYLGTIPDFAVEQPGYALSGVAAGGPADRAGMKGGDLLIRFGDSKIGNLEDIDGALRKYKAGDKVPVVVRRGGEELTLEVTLDPAR